MVFGTPSLRTLLTVSLLGVTQVVSGAKSDGCYKDFLKDFKPDNGYPSHKHTIGDRSVRTFLPPNYQKDEPNPLILAFHGRDMSSRGMEVTTGLSDGERNPDHVVIYPAAIDVSRDLLVVQ
ncbi:hypothetical protein P152DRAFT_453835 [Eremomyces bilateralis CBS 781.70]|uniref:Feruloyl esterase n=1 Tax=Eremomyces bilateralis CBS 781.70 TaxID=1392243 RepID=A0A6G1GGL7_9PEZI|nr:uncharacterized protein P152DRAFT_453835 [Eremomyces bilateralis CBS 781.70]KAF1817247.1 hypothetical protein P152DRAFT_453835 [Eremomyces bilateralis CBS 781.70]